MKTLITSRFWTLAGMVGALLAQTSPAAVTVYGTATSDGPTISVNIFADIPNAPLVSFGVRLLYDSQALSVQSASKNTAVWYLAAGTNQFPYLDPEVTAPGTVLIIGGKFDGANPLQGVSGQQVLLGTVTFGRLVTAPAQFGLALGRTPSFANFVTTTSTVLDDLQDGVVFNGVRNDPNDTDLDGLPDAWELRYFGGLGQANWSDDSDQDGFNNLQEYGADTNPTNSNSCLRMTGISPSGPGFLVQWQGGTQATQYLQRCSILGNLTNPWVDITTNMPPTPIAGSYTDSFHAPGPMFYRIRAIR